MNSKKKYLDLQEKSTNHDDTKKLFILQKKKNVHLLEAFGYLAEFVRTIVINMHYFCKINGFY